MRRVVCLEVDPLDAEKRTIRDGEDRSGDQPVRQVA
jgi:hypothetical protein